MKRTFLTMIVSGIIVLSLVDLAFAGIGTWGGTPPPPNVLIVRFHVQDETPGFDDQVGMIRNVAARYVLNGGLCEYKEFRDTLVYDGAKFAHIRIAFQDPEELWNAQEEFKALDKTMTEVVYGFSRECYFKGEPIPDIPGDLHP